MATGTLLLRTSASRSSVSQYPSRASSARSQTLPLELIWLAPAFISTLQTPVQSTRQRRARPRAPAHSSHLTLGESARASTSNVRLFSTSALRAFDGTLPTALSATLLLAFAHSHAYEAPDNSYQQAHSSNLELDPRGIDYSVFEAPSEEYKARISLSTPTAATGALAGASNDAATGPSSLLRSLIQARDLQGAALALRELGALDTPLGPPLREYMHAAYLYALADRRGDALRWLALAPTAWGKDSTVTRKALLRKDARKLAGALLDVAPTDLSTLRRATLLAVRSGYGPEFVPSVLPHILRYTDADADPEAGWAFWTELVSTWRKASIAHLTEAGTPKTEGANTQERRNSRPARQQLDEIRLRRSFNLAIRTLALSGRPGIAVEWARRAVPSPSSDSAAFPFERFTYRLLLEELLQAGDDLAEEARKLHARCVDIPELDLGISLDALQRVVREYPDAVEDRGLDARVQDLIAEGNLDGARNELMMALQESDSPPADNGLSPGIYAHLPSSTTLAMLSDAIENSYSPSASSESSSAPSADRFLHSYRHLLRNTRAGRGLWEMASLLRLVRAQKYQEATQYWSATYRPAGGIDADLIALALGNHGPTQTHDSRTVIDAQEKTDEPRYRIWPTSSAVALMLRALVGACGTNLRRVEEVYVTWLRTAFHGSTRLDLPSQDSLGLENSYERQSETADDWRSLLKKAYAPYTAAPPRAAADSYAFDTFLRAFATLNPAGAASNYSPSTPARTGQEGRGSSARVLRVVGDMADRGIRPSVASWTILLDTLAREGDWERTLDLARGMGMGMDITDKTTHLVQGASDSEISQSTNQEPSIDFPRATLATYTALLHALLRVPPARGGPMLDQAVQVRQWMFDAAHDASESESNSTKPVDDLAYPQTGANAGSPKDTSSRASSSQLRTGGPFRAYAEFMMRDVLNNPRTRAALEELDHALDARGQEGKGKKTRIYQHTRPKGRAVSDRLACKMVRLEGRDVALGLG